MPKAQVYGGLIAVVVLAVLGLILTRTWLGRAIRAAAANPTGAELVGIKVDPVARAGLRHRRWPRPAPAARSSGVLYPFVPGTHYIWIARLLAIVVLGGLGSLDGRDASALVFGLAETITAATSRRPGPPPSLPHRLRRAARPPPGLLGTRLREDAVAA